MPNKCRALGLVFNIRGGRRGLDADVVGLCSVPFEGQQLTVMDLSTSAVVGCLGAPPRALNFFFYHDALKTQTFKCKIAPKTLKS